MDGDAKSVGRYTIQSDFHQLRLCLNLQSFNEEGFNHVHRPGSSKQFSALPSFNSRYNP
jgi:hypothetical protein